MRYKTSFLSWLFIGYLLVLTMVCVGGITRLTGSGLSMADWKPIMGSVPPLNQDEWLKKFGLYKQTPEFKLKNNHFELSDFKGIFWWEFIHRLLGRFIGVVFFVPFLFFWIKKQLSKTLFKQLVFLLFLGGFQGLLGWYMVKSGLDKLPHVSHFRLAAHLITATITLLWITKLFCNTYFSNAKKLITPLHTYSKILFGLVLLQIVYGAFTAGLKAGFGNHTLFDVFNVPKVFKSCLNDSTQILFIHRYLGLSILGLFSILFYKFAHIKDKLIRKGLRMTFLIVFVQVGLGIFTLLFSVPISLGVLHQLVAILLATSILFLINRTAH